jgi:hypothetical protein
MSCLQMASRASKQAAKDADDYTALYTSVGRLLVAITPRAVPETMTAGTLASDDEAATLAERLVEALSSFVLNGHLAKVDVQEVQLQFLWQLARLLGSEHLPLAVLTLPAWRRLVQAHERSVNRTGVVAPLQQWPCIDGNGLSVLPLGGRCWSACG